MKPGIHVSKIWFDDNVIELNVRVSNSSSAFSNQVYVGYPALSDAVSSLNLFKDQVHGGLLDLRLGEFGPEYANGAFHARFHYPRPGRLFVSCKQESDFMEFAQKTVADSAKIHLESEPALLDRFVRELRSIASGSTNDAHLEAI